MGVPSADELARRDLSRALESLRGDARRALGLGAGANAADVRRAFNDLAKRYHPVRFARRDPAVVRLANDVFLALRDAQRAALAELPVAPPTRLAAVPAPPPPPVATSRVATVPMTAAAMQRAPSVVAVPAANLRSPVVQAVPAPRPAMAPPVQATGTRAPIVPPAPRPPMAPPVQATSTRAPIVPPAPRPPMAPPVQATSTRAPIVPPAPAPRPPIMPPATFEPSPPPRRQRPSSTVPGKQPRLTAEEIKAVSDAAARTHDRFERALAAIRGQRWSDARVELEQLATEAPADGRYRAYLHYAQGWSAFQLGRDSEARTEWQRALACDPGLGLARWALESTGLGR